jgi:hypothetical protein
MVAADALKRLMRRSPGTHVVLGVHLEEAGLGAFRQDGIQVLVLEAGSVVVGCGGSGWTKSFGFDGSFEFNMGSLQLQAPVAGGI